MNEQIQPNKKPPMTSRRIVNSFMRGDYTDESSENISSAISASDKPFDCTAIHIQINLAEIIIENLPCIKGLYEMLKTGSNLVDALQYNLSEMFPEATYLDRPMVKKILLVLATPALWESLALNGGDGPSIEWLEEIKTLGLLNKFKDDEHPLTHTRIFNACYRKKEYIASFGIDYSNLSLALTFVT